MLNLIINFLWDLLRPKHDLLLENIALRQQILVLERHVKRPKFRNSERAFWVVLSRYWAGWKSPLRLVKPETVISWHRKSWRLFWRWKSKPTDYGRPNLPCEVINLIRKMSLENPLWGAPRIHGELVMLGIDVSESTVAKYMVKRKGRPTQNWKTFLENHLSEIAAIDFLTIPTITFRTLYVFVVLSLDRRQVVHFNVTSNPTAEWTARQLVQAFPFESAPKYLIRDRDGIYGGRVLETIKFLNMHDKVISARSPWQNGYCERVVGTIKREFLNHMIIFNESHARRLLKKYFEYYHEDRTHLGLDKETPSCRKVEPPHLGLVKRKPMAGGLHSRYFREAA